MVAHHATFAYTNKGKEQHVGEKECATILIVLFVTKIVRGEDSEEGGGQKTWYIGETSRSSYERVKEHF